MASKELPTLEYTPIESLKATHDALNKTFLSHKTRPISFRLTQLRKLWWAIKDAEDQLTEACSRDLGKPHFETYLAEVGWVLNDIIFVCNNLEKWAKDESAEDIPLQYAPMKPKIRKDPLGVVLVLGAFNFPVQLQLGPFIGAIAAGCTAVLKPSENSPYTAVVLQQIVAASLDPTAYTVVQGGIPESTELLECKWDKIFYTGGATVGTIVAKKAAETLTPVALELGGRNPAIVTKNADPRLAARRLLWAKLHNAGQVCISQNYILVEKDVLPLLIAELRIAIAEFYPKGTKESKDFARIVNDRSFQRLKKMLDSTNGKIHIGGDTDAATKFIDITVVEVSSPSDSLLVDESFGPLIPILPVENLDEAIRIANQVDSTPLGIYPFGSTAETDRIISETRSGGASINDGFFHGSIPTLAFGGVGGSGQGSYRGKASFDCFTHRRSITYTPAWTEALLAIRYPPYDGKVKQLKLLNDSSPNFDRAGQVKTNPVKWLFGLISKVVSTGVNNRFVVLVAILSLRQWLVRSGRW